MKKLVVMAVSLSLSLVTVAGSTVAQEKNVSGISTNADGSYVTSTAGVNPTANGGGGTIIYGDITTGSGITVIGPPAAAPAPAPEPVPVSTTDNTAPSAIDLDADNYADEQEWGLGLDPNNADTDADGVADGDEITIYGTEPTLADTDGDDIADGEELFGILTDPLVWNDPSAEATESVTPETATEDVSESSSVTPAASETLAQETTENMTATDGNAAARGPGNASAAPGTVTRPGSSILGPDGAYSVTDNAPSTATISGDTEVLAPPAAPAAVPTTTVAGCDSYGSWYDAQIAYEAAGLTSADSAVVSALDPDYDGIACEEGM